VVPTARELIRVHITETDEVLWLPTSGQFSFGFWYVFFILSIEVLYLNTRLGSELRYDRICATSCYDTTWTVTMLVLPARNLQEGHYLRITSFSSPPHGSNPMNAGRRGRGNSECSSWCYLSPHNAFSQEGFFRTRYASRSAVLVGSEADAE